MREPQTFCYFAALISFRSGQTLAVFRDTPVRFSEVFEAAGAAVDEACFNRAKQTTECTE